MRYVLSILVCAATLVVASAFPFSFWGSTESSVGLPVTHSLFSHYIMDDQPYTNEQTMLLVHDSLSDNDMIVDTVDPLILNTAVLNGHNIATFKAGPGGVSLNITNIADVSINGFTMAVVCLVTPNASFTDVPCFSIRGDNKATIGYQILGTNVAFRGTGNNQTASVTNALNTWQVVTMSYDRTEGVTRTKNNTDSSESSASTAASFAADNIFFQTGTTNRFAEWIIYTNKLSDSEVSSVRSYLADKYAISITP